MRRTVVTGFLVGLLVVAAGCDGGGESDAGRDGGEDGGADCTPPAVSCPGAGCVNTSSSAEHCGECGNSCGGCDRCIMGTCTPACCASEVDCDPSPSATDCIDAEFDRANCGYCGTTCAEDEICYSRRCLRCEPPQVRCGNTCADLSDDLRHCGDCDTVCERMYCQCGVCVPERTDAGCE